MNENCKKACKPVFIGSLTLNVFLIAFILGKLSVFGPPGGPAMMPPPPHGAPPEMAGIPHGGDMPPPPPGIGGGPGGILRPTDLFTPEELQQHFSEMQEAFDRVKAVRTDFANKIKGEGLTREEVLQNLSEVDKIMDGVRSNMQQKAADKLMAMTPDERSRVAERILQGPQRRRGGPGMGGPKGDMPPPEGDMPPPMPQ